METEIIIIKKHELAELLNNGRQILNNYKLK
jgi:hypothetical protein